MKILRMQQFSYLINRRIGQALKKERLNAGFSRQGVSNATGIPVSMIVQYEQDATLPSDYRFDAMLKLYGTNADEFLKTVIIPNWDDIIRSPLDRFLEESHE